MALARTLAISFHLMIGGGAKFEIVKLPNGRVAKWLERLTAEQNIDGSIRTLGLQLGCSLTVHPAANGYLVAKLGSVKLFGFYTIKQIIVNQ